MDIIICHLRDTKNVLQKKETQRVKNEITYLKHQVVPSSSEFVSFLYNLYTQYLFMSRINPCNTPRKGFIQVGSG